MDKLNDLKDKFLMLEKRDKIIFLSLISAIIIIVIILISLIPKLFSEGETGNNKPITGTQVTSTIIGKQNSLIEAVGNDYKIDYVDYSFNLTNSKRKEYRLNDDYIVAVRVLEVDSGYEYTIKVNDGGSIKGITNDLGKINISVAHNQLFYLVTNHETPGYSAIYIFDTDGDIKKSYGDMNKNLSGMHPISYEVSNETGFVINATREVTKGYILYGNKKIPVNICDENESVKIPSATAITATYKYNFKSDGKLDYDNYKYEQGILKDEYIQNNC